MEIKENVPLAPLTSFQVGGSAERFVSVKDESELADAVRYAQQHELSLTIIAGGTNVLVPDAGIRGLVVKNDISGIDFTEDGDDVFVSAAAGEEFDALISTCVARRLWGLENLSAIPGSVGATPIQNVGAYGVEIQDVIASVRVYDAETDTFVELEPGRCRFGYRDSMFKHPEGKHCIVTGVTYRLSKTSSPKLTYRDLTERFVDTTPTLEEIRNAVIDIRARKFPDWRRTGTAGSFFKNPTVLTTEFEALRARYPGLPGFPVGDIHTKIPLGWIIDHVLGKRGYRDGAVGTFEGQALVLINHGHATADDIESFAETIASEIEAATGITPEWEVTLLDHVRRQK